MTQSLSLQAQIPISASGQRLDQTCAELFPDYSRERLKEWIKNGQITLEGKKVKPNAKVCGGEKLVLEAELEPQGEWIAEDLDFEVVYEDEDIIVVNKPADLVVHPAAGNYQGTLLNGLIHRYPELIEVPRAGIVHRLDKDTTGLMVVARNLSSQAKLVEQLQARTVSRQYVAICLGAPPVEGKVDKTIGRDPNHRKRMAVVRSGGKEAITHFQLAERLGAYSLINLKLETGRTHQIRVHMAHLGFPLLGDPVYGRKPGKNLNLTAHALEHINQFTRQALHAAMLGLEHPSTGRLMHWEAEIPDDMYELIELLAQ